MAGKGHCPECGMAVGEGTGVDPYKHLVACLHLPDVGVDNLLKAYERDNSLYAQRVRKGLALAKAGG